MAESLQPGVNISDLARRSGVNRGLLQTWRRTAMRGGTDRGQVFVPLRLEETSAPAQVERPTREGECGCCGPDLPMGMIELESGGLRVRFSGPVEPAALRLVLSHLGRRA